MSKKPVIINGKFLTPKDKPVSKPDYSKFMKEQALAEKKAKEEAEEKERLAESENAGDKGPIVPLAKTTNLVFFRQYNTYQALLEVHPRGDLSADLVYKKVILYIMRWFRNRLGADAKEAYPECTVLWERYPEPEDVEHFDLEAAEDIHGFDFIDFETAFLKKKWAWVVCLTEPDNGRERTDIQGRTFTTEISVYQKERSVVLGIREACREPEENTEDAFGFRPGFVRDIFYDTDLLVGEQGIDPEYAFSREAYRLNGKAGEACERLHTQLIVSSERQMPILFIPGEFYAEHKEEVNQKTESLLGYCHVVVLENGCRKLFEQIMENDEFVEVMEEGQLIFYRTNTLQEYPNAYFEDEADGVLDEIKKAAMNEPLRKFCDFKEYSFKPSWREGLGEQGDLSEEIENLRGRFEAELAESQRKVNDLERDNDHLQRRFNEIEAENKKLDKEFAKNTAEVVKVNAQLDSALAENKAAKTEIRRLQATSMKDMLIANGALSTVKERYKPLINLPPLSREKKEDILNWIREYYSDALVIHSRAESSFFDDNRNLDWHRFCMMIHFLAGYTRYRKGGGVAFDTAAARDYDVEDSAYTVDPTSSGQGAMEFHKDKYTITIEEDGASQEVLLDMHLKYGKGMDDNMIRIYFHYSSVEKKSFIGYMPGHLPLR